MACALTVWTETMHPFGLEPWSTWIDVLADEWPIWFTILYVALIAVPALAAKVHRRPGARRSTHGAASTWGR